MGAGFTTRLRGAGLDNTTPLSGLFCLVPQHSNRRFYGVVAVGGFVGFLFFFTTRLTKQPQAPLILRAFTCFPSPTRV